MTGVPSYSTTPSENVLANTGINWDEGMSPAAVNNSARQNMTDVRLQWNDSGWFAYGTGSKTTVIPVYVSGTSFKVAGIDVTAYWHVGRRVKAVGSGTGTIYGIITASAFSTDTTCTISWDSGSLSNETLAIYGGTIPATGSPVPMGATVVRAVLGVTTRSGISSASGVMLGFGGTLALTPRFSGRVRVSIAAYLDPTNTSANSVTLYYGTSTAPSNGAALTGTATDGVLFLDTTPAVRVNASFTIEISGLSVGTAYWFDLGVITTGGATIALVARQIVVQEIP